nr:MAG TPA: hypothetical protein [Caudoviricetes sp.]
MSPFFCLNSFSLFIYITSILIISQNNKKLTKNSLFVI